MEISYSMVVNDYLGFGITNRPHATPNYGPLANQGLKFIITDRHTPENWLIYEQNWKNQVNK